ncbi:hypothetical protein Tco_1089679 [Tanacetum coccineum]
MYNSQRASPPPNQSSPIPAFNIDDDSFKPLWASASQPSQYTEGPSQPVEDDSPVEEVAAVKPKRKYTRRCQPIKKSDKEFVEPWTIEEEVALCKDWVLASENSIRRNRKKASGTSVTTSQGNSDSIHIVLNLNDEAYDLEDVEVQEVAPIGRDRAKKKASSSGARSKTSVAGDPSLVNALLRTDISKITRKQSKNGQARTRESDEYKRSQRFKAEARKVKPQSNPVKHGQQKVNQ